MPDLRASRLPDQVTPSRRALIAFAREARLSEAIEAEADDEGAPF
jgi:hypothetical protein